MVVCLLDGMYSMYRYLCSFPARVVHRYLFDRGRAPASRQSTRDHCQHNHHHHYQQQAAAAVPQLLLLLVVVGVAVLAAQLLQFVGRGGGAVAAAGPLFLVPGTVQRHSPHGRTITISTALFYQRAARGPL